MLECDMRLHAPYAMRSMAEQMRAYHPVMSAEEIIARMLDKSPAVLMSEYAAWLVEAGHISREAAVREIQAAV